VENVFMDLNFQLEQKYVHNYEIHEFQKCEPINSYGLLNDQIWNLFSKVPILIMFCWIDVFSFHFMYVKGAIG
jgi:hypothetical protein